MTLIFLIWLSAYSWASDQGVHHSPADGMIWFSLMDGTSAAAIAGGPKHVIPELKEDDS